METRPECVHFSTIIKADQEKVFDSIATGEGLDQWFTQGSEVTLPPDRKIIFRWKDWGPRFFSGENGGPILEINRPKRLVFKWKSDDDTYLTRVEIDFYPIEIGTEVTLKESGFRDSTRGMQHLLDRCTGWGQALTLLKVYLEHGVTFANK